MLRTVLLLALLALPTTPLLATTPAATKAKNMAAYMRAQVQASHFMGAVLVARGDRVIFANGYGLANIDAARPNTPATRFRIGSVTKQFTAMAILMLQARGKLHIDDSICRHLSDCPSAWQPITIGDALDHSSGIPNFTAQKSYLAARGKTLTPNQVIDLFRDQPLDFPPGSQFHYSNSGYEVLGAIIEHASGQDYATFLRQHIFTPLGMTHSGYGHNSPDGKNHAQGYTWNGSGYTKAPFVDMSVPFSAGALYSTVRDLYTWDRALDTNAGKLLPAPLHRQLFAHHMPMDANDADGPWYGLGWMIGSRFGHTHYWHNGGIAGFTALNSWYPDQHLYIIVLDNMASPAISDIGRALAAIAFDQPYTTPTPHQAIELPNATLQQYVGTYQLEPGFTITITREGNQLMAQASGQSAHAIYPSSKADFFYKVADIQIHFQHGDHGQVSGLILHQDGKDHAAKRLPTGAPATAASTATTTPHQAITLPASRLARYVGTYQLAPSFAITITREGTQLMAQATGQPAFPIYPRSKTEFFYQVVDAQLTFQTNAKGQVTGLVLHQNGRDLPGKKMP